MAPSNTQGDEGSGPLLIRQNEVKAKMTEKRGNQLHRERTCPDVLAEANRERVDAFFRRLVADGKVDAYLAAIAKRATLGTVQAIADRIRTLDAGNAPRPEQRARSQP